MTTAFAKSNFRNGGANLPVCLDSLQGIATLPEITFGNQSNEFDAVIFIEAGSIRLVVILWHFRVQAKPIAM
jgi:hypothetical protein